MNSPHKRLNRYYKAWSYKKKKYKKIKSYRRSIQKGPIDRKSVNFVNSQKLGSRHFWWIANSVLNKDKSAVPPLFNGPEVLSSASDKAKLFAENFSKNSNLDDSGISLPVFPSRTNLKLHNISVTPKMVKKVIMNLDLSKASGPNCIPVVVLKNCEPELSYILLEFFNIYLKEYCFPDSWKVSSVAPVFENVEETCTTKNYRPVSLLSVVNKVFWKTSQKKPCWSPTDMWPFFKFPLWC